MALLASARAARAEGTDPFPGHPRWRFVFVNHVTTNLFFVLTQYRLQDACGLLGCDHQWTGSANLDVSKMVNAMNAAIAAKASAIAIPIIDSKAFNGPTARARRGHPSVRLQRRCVVRRRRQAARLCGPGPLPGRRVEDVQPQPEALRAEGIVKRFGAVTALSGVSLNLRRGEILGDNGAGKSTLTKILTGFQPPTEGKLFVNGVEVVLRSVDHARSLGIECVYQDLALANSLSVYHNLFLNREILYPGPFRLLNNRAMRRQAEACLEGIRVHIPWVSLPVERLSGGQRQAIAVARAVNSKARVLLLDEPLAVMGAREAGLIIDLILRLKAAGDLSIIMIMHNYAQTLEIADRIMLMQRGRVTYENHARSTSVEELMDIVRRGYRSMRAH